MTGDPVNDVLPEEVPLDAAADSPADRLKRRYLLLQEDQHTDLDIPGYGGDLVGRYAPVDRADLKRIGRKLGKAQPEDREILASMDLISEACQGLFFRQEDGDLTPLGGDGDPVRYDERLAAIMGFEADSVRTCVRKVFTVAGKFNAGSLVSHAQDVGAFIQDVSSEVGETLAGE